MMDASLKLEEKRLSETQACQVCGHEEKIKKCPECKRFTCEDCLDNMLKQGYDKHTCLYCGYIFKQFTVFEPKKTSVSSKKILRWAEPPQPATTTLQAKLDPNVEDIIIRGGIKNEIIHPNAPVTYKDVKLKTTILSAPYKDVYIAPVAEYEVSPIKTTKAQGHSRWKIVFEDGFEFVPEDVYINHKFDEVGISPVQSSVIQWSPTVEGQFRITTDDNFVFSDMTRSKHFDVYRIDKIVAQNCIAQKYHIDHMFHQNIQRVTVDFNGWSPKFTRKEKPPVSALATMKV